MENTHERILQEYVHAGEKPLRVDRRNGLIRGVKLLGLRSRNGRIYLPEALAQACPLYEGAKVNVNHAPLPLGMARDYRDRIGVVRQVRFVDKEGLFADLVYNPKHALAEQLAWDAEHLPENVGLSHHVLARTRQEGQETIVEAILHVYSVDLVADPAATSGLFEGARPLTANEPGPGLAAATNTPAGGPAGEGVPFGSWAEDRPQAGKQGSPDEPMVDNLRAEAELLRQKLARAERTLVIWRSLAEFGLPLPGTSPLARQLIDENFLESLYTLPDEAEVRRRVGKKAESLREEFPRLWGLPAGRHRPETPQANDLEQFVRSICRR